MSELAQGSKYSTQSWLHSQTKFAKKSIGNFGDLNRGLLHNRPDVITKQLLSCEYCAMNTIECKALQQLQQHCTTLHSTCDVSGWTVHTGKQGLYYLHTATSLAFHTLAAARVAVDAFHCFARKSAADDDDDDDDENDETLSIASCLDDIVAQLHKYTDTLQTQRKLTQDAAEVSLALQPKIVDMYDACPYLEINRKSMTLTQQDTLLQRSTKLRCQLLLATCAVFIQKLLNRSSYTSGIGSIACIHCCKS